MAVQNKESNKICSTTEDMSTCAFPKSDEKDAVKFSLADVDNLTMLLQKSMHRNKKSEETVPKETVNVNMASSLHSSISKPQRRKQGRTNICGALKRAWAPAAITLHKQKRILFCSDKNSRKHLLKEMRDVSTETLLPTFPLPTTPYPRTKKKSAVTASTEKVDKKCPIRFKEPLVPTCVRLLAVYNSDHNHKSLLVHDEKKQQSLPPDDSMERNSPAMKKVTKIITAKESLSVSSDTVCLYTNAKEEQRITPSSAKRKPPTKNEKVVASCFQSKVVDASNVSDKKSVGISKKQQHSSPDKLVGKFTSALNDMKIHVTKSSTIPATPTNLPTNMKGKRETRSSGENTKNKPLIAMKRPLVPTDSNSPHATELTKILQFRNWVNLGKLHCSPTKKDYHKAEEYFTKALDLGLPLTGQIGPEIAEVHEKLGDTLATLGYVAFARRHYRFALCVHEKCHKEQKTKLTAGFKDMPKRIEASLALLPAREIHDDEFLHTNSCPLCSNVSNIMSDKV